MFVFIDIKVYFKVAIDKVRTVRPVRKEEIIRAPNQVVIV